MSLRTALVYASLIALATGLALSTRLSAESRPDRATARSTGGGGLAALATWLRESGRDVRELSGPFSKLPADLRTLVVAAPSARVVSAEEVEALRAFANRGGRLVYLRGRTPQPELDGWLELADGAVLQPEVEATDLGGATARITLPGGPFAGLRSLRVSARRGISSADPHFLPVAMVGAVPVLLWRPEGRGEIFAAPHADIAENRRVELADNRVPWARMAAEGPLGFDEYHHEAPAPAPPSPGPWLFGVQAVLCAVLLALTRGTTLGPPRKAGPAPLPGAMAYASSFGRLLRSARIEAELVGSLEARLRRTLAERAGVSPSAPAVEISALLKLQQPELATAWAAWLEARASMPEQITPADFLRLSQLAAAVEMCARGLSAEV